MNGSIPHSTEIIRKLCEITGTEVLGFLRTCDNESIIPVSKCRVQWYLSSYLVSVKWIHRRAIAYQVKIFLDAGIIYFNSINHSKKLSQDVQFERHHHIKVQVKLSGVSLSMVQLEALVV